MISGLQIRAAKAFLRWSSADIADAANVGVTTVRRFELEDGVPQGNMRIILKIISAFEEAGIEFIGTPDDGPGVRLKPKSD
jgi:hypothetical protein